MLDEKALERAVSAVLGPQTWMVRSLVASDARLSRLPFGEAALAWMRRHMPRAAARVEETTAARSSPRD